MHVHRLEDRLQWGPLVLFFRHDELRPRLRHLLRHFHRARMWPFKPHQWKLLTMVPAWLEWYRYWRFLLGMFCPKPGKRRLHKAQGYRMGDALPERPFLRRLAW